ncbi:MAG TPA: sigma-70 family RNA polymerase sigma factor [Anaeromyxobacteraceae bacterium]|nr:sigma-70 family RNA polymerase sigma factor [Anaeromyxobacteraceae bacterium]
MALESSSEADLARRCRRGDADAWRELVRRFTPLVYRLSFRMLRDGAEAEDASQEVFLRMHRSFDGYDPTRPLAPWVSRTTYHACLRRLESAARRREGAEREASLAASDPVAQSPEQSAAEGEAVAMLARAVEDLPAQDRALLDLRYREGLSDAEVSEATGMPVGTVKTRLFRSRARLRAWLGPRLARSGQ